ncbi:MAG: DUF3365 domain-containing protein [Anaerolinea sp.]|nr:DUF3365 domain-containing protein [Anaerolinea sp.]MCC6976308.1 DUF3365 domain-containing protein [Anaerolineae bacterium]CAG0977082.1 hypothetical protein ANRL4_01633 [Anaerolineae bacterium]
MLAKLGLGTKFTLLLAAVLIMGIILGGTVLWQALNQKAQNDITSTGLMLMETMSAVRGYTSTHIQPLLADKLAASPEFVSESVPAFSARTVFERVRGDQRYQDYFYKEAAHNPTNPVDKADPFEAGVLDQFRADPAVRELTGFRESEGRWLYYTARPLTVSAESCLVCHGDPAQAPASLINSYGDGGGFGWKLKEVIAAQIIYVPASDVLNTAARSFVVVIGIFGGVFAISLFILNLLLRRYVIRPVGMLGEMARQISQDTLTSEQIQGARLARLAEGSDEVGNLAKVFWKMAEEVSAREERLKQKVQELSIQIDTVKRAQHVAAVTETEFFKDLQTRANSLRNRHDQQVAASGEHRKPRPLSAEGSAD